jgi:hypothetical protein
MSALKVTSRRFTAAERATLDPLIVRAAVAAVRQAKAEAAYERAARLHVDEASRKAAVRCDTAAMVAKRETCAAGKALDRAIKKLRGGK